GLLIVGGNRNVVGECDSGLEKVVDIVGLGYPGSREDGASFGGVKVAASVPSDVSRRVKLRNGQTLIQGRSPAFIHPVRRTGTGAVFKGEQTVIPLSVFILPVRQDQWAIKGDIGVDGNTQALLSFARLGGNQDCPVSGP